MRVSRVCDTSSQHPAWFTLKFPLVNVPYIPFCCKDLKFLAQSHIHNRILTETSTWALKINLILKLNFHSNLPLITYQNFTRDEIYSRLSLLKEQNKRTCFAVSAPADLPAPFNSSDSWNTLSQLARSPGWSPEAKLSSAGLGMHDVVRLVTIWPGYPFLYYTTRVLRSGIIPLNWTLWRRLVEFKYILVGTITGI